MRVTDTGIDRWQDNSFPIASVLTALMIGALLAGARALFGEDIVLATAFYFLTLAALVATYASGAGIPSLAIIRLLCAMAAIVLLCLAPIGLAGRVLCLVFGLTAVVLMFHLRGMRTQYLATSVGASGMLAVTLFSIVNGKYYANLFVPDSLLFGIVHTDTLYHSAIAAMFASFGVPSTGLDGIPLTRYHTLSNMLLGLLARGAEIPATTGYVLGMQIVLLPLVYFALSVSTAGALKELGRRHTLMTYLLPAVLLGGLALLDLSAYLVSESYALGLVVLLLGTAVLRPLAPGRPVSWVTLAAAGVVALVAMGTKISIGGVFLCGAGVAFLRVRSLRPAQYAAMAAFLVIIGLVTVALFLPASHGAQSRIAPLSFVIEYPLVFTVNMAIITVGWVIGWRETKVNPKAIWPTILLVMLLASTLPALLMHADGGSAYYFLNIGTWLAIVEISAIIIKRVGSRPVFFSLALVAVLASGTLSSILQQVPSRIFSTVEFYYMKAEKPVDAGDELSIWDQLLAYREVRASLPMSTLTAALREAKVHNRSMVLLDDAVWQELPFACTDAPFAVPAYVGLPLLMGLRTVARGCNFGPHYSYPDYDQSPPPGESLSVAQICNAAQARGFNHVLHARRLSIVDNVDCSIL